VNLEILSLKVVLGECDVPRLADKINDFSVTVIEVFVALNHSAPAQAFEVTARMGLTIGNRFFDVGERNCLAGMNQVRDQESRPCAAGSGIANKKGVIGTDREAAPAISAPNTCFTTFLIP
jgi:hypothetical protein